ncbi:MAG: PstS family phosphate ABC transporter substrate-binding protein [Bacteroidetes bacterium]|nr:PstS family phosphate ABC transporter substrate-binding protein [Bacteroidota bacterium]MBU1717881.1 PstS family phosphate ABC transporter substrate-binding protein [Bacteroidota bacterium]
MKSGNQIRAAFLAIFIACIIVHWNCSGGHEKADENNPGAELSGTISISGAFALYPITVRWAEEFMKLHPKVRIDISAGGAGKGMTDALSQMVHLGMFSRSVSDAETKQGAWYIAVTRDAVLPTINAENPLLSQILLKGMTKSDFAKIFLAETPGNWENYFDGTGSHPVSVYTRSDACGAAAMWAEFLGKNQEDLEGTGVFGDPGIADAVKADKYAIGYNNVNYAFDMTSRKKYPGIEIMPIDLNENGSIDPGESFYSCLDSVMAAIASEKYPSPPARDLFFVSKGKPTDKIVVEFLKWVLSEGQKYVGEAGYVKLSDEKIATELRKIN